MASRVLYPILAVYVLFAKPADFKFPREKVRLALETEGGVMDNWLRMHLHASFRRSAYVCTRRWSSMNKHTQLQPELFLWWFSIAVRLLVDQFPTVGHLKCAVKWCIKNPLEATRGVRANPLEPPLPTGLLNIVECCQANKNNLLNVDNGAPLFYHMHAWGPVHIKHITAQQIVVKLSSRRAYLYSGPIFHYGAWF